MHLTFRIYHIKFGLKKCLEVLLSDSQRSIFNLFICTFVISCISNNMKSDQKRLGKVKISGILCLQFLSFVMSCLLKSDVTNTMREIVFELCCK
jgi:hypothetical protein